MMTKLKVLTILSLVVLGLSSVPTAVIASDADPLQDFCIADLSAKGPFINGFPCLDPTQATAEDFAFSGLANAANLTGNPTNGTATFGFVREWPAVNTLGLGLARLDINPGGIIMPHTHNLATEILFCIEGEIYTGFVTNSDNPLLPNKLYAKIVKKGEAFIFPRGLLHFQLNKGTVPAVSINVLNSQNAGIQLMPVSLFGSGIDPELLAKSFFISEKEVAGLASIFTPIAKVL
jgi:hypothetical protein